MSDSDGHSPLFWIFIGILFMGIAYLIFFIVPKLIAHYLPGLIFLMMVSWPMHKAKPEWDEEWTEDRVVQELLKLPKGILVGMFIDLSERFCRKERIERNLYWHLLFRHEVPEAYARLKWLEDDHTQAGP